MSGPVCLVPAGDWTGEAATWSAAEQALYWVDVQRFLIHRYDPATRATRSWLFDEPATAIGLTDRPDTFVVALASKAILWQPANDARVDLSRLEDGRSVRMNDGRPDPAGNFWVGSMENNIAEDGGDLKMSGEPMGRLFRITGDGTTTVERTGIRISNTLCWSPDARLFYFADTPTNEIRVFDYDVASGTIGDDRPFFADFERGMPDGSAMDSEGYLWNARWGGACVVRVAPDGSVDRVVEMPVDNVTTCTFGGADLRTLFITTARGGGGPMMRLAGGLFAIDAPVPGLPENIFRLAT